MFYFSLSLTTLNTILKSSTHPIIKYGINNIPTKGLKKTIPKYIGINPIIMPDKNIQYNIYDIIEMNDNSQKFAIELTENDEFIELND